MRKHRALLNGRQLRNVVGKILREFDTAAIRVAAQTFEVVALPPLHAEIRTEGGLAAPD